MKTANKADQVRETLRERILSGEFGRRGRLPSLRMLATEYKISQETINKVIQVLQAEGWILSLGQRGVFVNMPRIRFPGFLKTPSSYAAEMNVDPVEEYVEDPKVLIPPVEIATAMNLDQDEKTVRRFFRFGIPNVILRISEVYFPKTLISDDMFKKMEDPHFDVVPEIKKETGKIIKYSNDEVIARFPTEFEQEQLKIVRTNPIIDIKRVCFTEDKKTAVMYIHLVLNANHFLLTYSQKVDFWD
jgi:DNA-binding GntR family transcriptional regulator